MSTKTPEILQATLEKIFHSPARMAIISALAAADKSGLAFSELKETCDLTDGNLSGHLNALTEEDVIKIKKEFVDNKPRTTITLTKTGLDRFSQYLDALQDALKAAKAALPAPARKASAPAGARAARA
jgi:DNA-binding MarR family transcriptional regulator